MARRTIWVQRITAFLVASIAALAFWLSFDAIRLLAVDNGVPAAHAWKIPLIVDGAMIVFSLNVMRATLAGERTWWSWCLIGIFTAVSLVFNIMHSNMRPVGIAMAALAPSALFFTFETLMTQIRNAVQGGIDRLAKRWQRRARELLRLAKAWRGRARELKGELQEAEKRIATLQETIQGLQEAGNRAQALEAENGRLQDEIERLQVGVDRLQEIAAYWEHMNETAQAAAMYNVGVFDNLKEAAAAGGVSDSTISRLAGKLNGAAT